jgi:FMN-dependent oxidoreductase (nitrilotriacetate monooxygenase family)
MSAEAFHLGWFLGGSSAGAWGQPWAGTTGRTWMRPETFLDMARALERASFDYLLLEDSSYVADVYGGSMQLYLEHAIGTPRQDPAVVAGLMTQVTSRLGIVATLGTYAYPPYLLARLVGTLDQVSGGRIGWNVVTGSSNRAAQNFGLPEMPEHDLRYEMADEYLEVVNGLWGSWEPDAIVADMKSGVFADWTKVHAIDHAGVHFACRGPLNSGPLPQGRPVIAQAGGSPAGRQFAAKHADTVVTTVHGAAAMKEYRDDVRRRMEGLGRKPDECKVLFVVSPVLGATEAEARVKLEDTRRRKLADAELRLAKLAKATDIDFGQFDLDAPIGDRQLSTNGHQRSLADFLSEAGDRTLREAAATVGNIASVELAGTPDQVAGQMDEVMDTVGGDGFLFYDEGTSAHYISEIVDGLVPALQRRGLTRQTYTFPQFRDNLLEF